jgi:hypothetical protein
MGMYNEVYADCPECGASCYMQISQVVFGFGGFNLDDLSTFDRLSDKEVEQVRDLVMEEDFFCNNDECWGGSFNPLKKEVYKKDRARTILFGEDEDDNEE